MFQPDFLIAAKLIHLVSDVVFEALDVLLVRPTIIIMLLLTSQLFRAMNILPLCILGFKNIN